MTIIFLLGIAFQVANMVVNLNFLAVQKEVQNGNNDVWRIFLLLLLALSVFSVLQVLYMTFFHNTLHRYLTFNLFKRYRRIFRVQEKGVLMKFQLIFAELMLPLSIVTAFVGCYTIVKTMEMVTFNIQNIIVAILLLVSAMICGIIRGRCESSKKKIDSIIQEKKNDLTKFDSFSTTYLNNALYVLDIEYRASMNFALKKSFFENLPRFLKQLLCVVLFWGLVDSVLSGSIYSESYLLLTAYGTVLSIAEQVGSICEKCIEIVHLRKDEDVKALNLFENKENAHLELNRERVTLDEKGLTITSLFSLDVHGAGGKVRLYQLNKDIIIPKGKHVILTGAKEVGKTRFLSFLEALFPGCIMIYNDNAKVFNHFYDNFKSKYGFDGELIRELALGLRLERFTTLSDEELKKLQVTNINTADKHLCVALVMLYLAIKNPCSAKIMVFDELFANVDFANSEAILEFIMKKVGEIGSTVIFVGHSNQELIKTCCASHIKMTALDTSIKINQVQL